MTSGCPMGEREGRRECPVCNGRGYVEPAGDEQGSPKRKRVFSGGYLRVMRLR